MKDIGYLQRLILLLVCGYIDLRITQSLLVKRAHCIVHKHVVGPWLILGFFCQLITNLIVNSQMTTTTKTMTR